MGGGTWGCSGKSGACLQNQPVTPGKGRGGRRGRKCGSEATRAQNTQIQIKRSRQASGIPSHLFTFHFLHSKPPFLFLGWVPGDALGEAGRISSGLRAKEKVKESIRTKVSALLPSGFSSLALGPASFGPPVLEVG